MINPSVTMSSNVAMDEESMWQAVLARDSRADGKFVLAVHSTGIYCRPTCPARRPKRENVSFYPHPQAAEQAGFRACLRCLPQQELEPLAAMVQRACDYITTHLDAPLTLAALGKELAVSPYHLQRTFKRILGLSPRQYLAAARRDQLKDGLKQGQSVTEAVYDAGYSSPSRAYAADMGMTPATYGRGGKGMSITYAVVPSPLGCLLVGGTARGICAVCLGDDAATLEAALRHEYPAADIRRDDTGLGSAVAAILDYLGGKPLPPALPLDLQATAFQQRVWQALRDIPYGSTRSYQQVAQAIGQPTASRAVAHACATNRVALVIPCHRVMREGGGLGGYRWGVERKRRLLAQEQATATQPPLLPNELAPYPLIG